MSSFDTAGAIRDVVRVEDLSWIVQIVLYHLKSAL